MRRAAAIVYLAIAFFSTARAAARPPSKDGKSYLQIRQETTIGNVNSFGFRLLDLLDDKGAAANTFYSPVSVSTALGMLAQGASDDSRTLMEISQAFGGAEIKGNNSNTEGAVFHFVLNDAAGHALGSVVDPKVTIDMANAAWFNVGQPIKATYQNALRDLYGAKIRKLTTGDEINSFVERRTNGMISDIVPSGPMDAAGVLVNAIYFKGEWQKPFDKERTEEAIFYTPSGPVPAQMMVTESGTKPFEKEALIVAVNIPTGEGSDTLETKVVEYDFGENDEYSVVIVVPNLSEEEKEALDVTSKLDIIIAQLSGNPGEWDRWMDLLATQSNKEEETVLSMPRFKVETEVDLVGALSSMGIKAPFEQIPGQFVDISNDPQLYVDQMKHKAVLDLDEEGAEAAAATIAQLVPLSFRGVPKSVVVDSPFLFFIRGKRTGMVLFAGKIVHPEFT